MSRDLAIMWFRRDLRLGDHPALMAALSENAEVLPVFVVDPFLVERSGQPRLAYMAAALESLNKSMGGALVVRVGDPAAVIPALAAEIGATTVYVSKDFAPYGRRRDEAIAERLAADGRRLRGGRLTVCRRSGPGHQRRRHVLFSVHTLFEAVAGPRLVVAIGTTAQSFLVHDVAGDVFVVPSSKSDR